MHLSYSPPVNLHLGCRGGHRVRIFAFLLSLLFSLGFFFSFGRREPHGKEWRCNRADNPFTHLVRYILIDCKSESTAGSAFQLLRSRAGKGGVGRASWFQLVTTARSSLPVRSPFHDHLTRFASFRPARPWPIVMTTARRDGEPFGTRIRSRTRGRSLPQDELRLLGLSMARWMDGWIDHKYACWRGRGGARAQLKNKREKGLGAQCAGANPKKLAFVGALARVRGFPSSMLRMYIDCKYVGAAADRLAGECGETDLLALRTGQCATAS